MLELNKIYCGDNLSLIKDIDNNCIDLHFHSPPYANIKSYLNFDGINPGEFVDWYLPRVYEIYRTLKGSGSFILNINDKVDNGFRSMYVFELVWIIVKETGFKLYERLFWNKGKYLPNRNRFGDKVEYIFWFVKSKDFVFNIDEMRVAYDPKSINRMKKPIKKRFCRDINNNNTIEYKEWKPNEKGALPSTLINIGSESQRVSNNHFAVMPLKLAEYFIKGATNERGLVCDIFSGSGTTCLAAKNLIRNFIGFDIFEQYCNEARIRCRI